MCASTTPEVNPRVVYSASLTSVVGRRGYLFPGAGRSIRWTRDMRTVIIAHRGLVSFSIWLACIGVSQCLGFHSRGMRRMKTDGWNVRRWKGRWACLCTGVPSFASTWPREPRLTLLGPACASIQLIRFGHILLLRGVNSTGSGQSNLRTYWSGCTCGLSASDVARISIRRLKALATKYVSCVKFRRSSR